MATDLAIFLSTTGYSGTDRMASNLVAALARRGYTVDLLKVRRRGPYFSEVPEGVRIIDLGTAHTYSSLMSLVRYLRKERPRALFCDKDRINHTAILAHALAGSSAYLAVSTGTTLSIDCASRGFFYRAGTRFSTGRLYRYADKVIVPSRGVADDMSSYTGLSRDRIHVLPCPVVPARVFDQAFKRPDHPWFTDGGPPIIMGLGELCARKDFVTLIRAFAKVRDTYSCRLMILGRGSDRERLIATAHELGVAADVALPGFVDEPYAWLAEARLFAFTSLLEGLGFALIEALAVGVPSVSTDCPSGPAEILQDGHYGPLVGMGDYAGLAAAMLAVLKNPLPRVTLQEAARPYEIENATSAFIDALQLGPPATRRSPPASRPGKTPAADWRMPEVRDPSPLTLAIIGGGPAGLMAAEVASSAGVTVDLFDAMPSVGRKFLLAGKGGLNLTHAEPFAPFIERYGVRREWLEPFLRDCDATAIRAWAAGLGVSTFVGSSRRIFPLTMKASPLLRAWLRRLRGQGVRFHVRHRWQGWTTDGGWRFDTPSGQRTLRPRATILALGGGSWSRLGSDGAWAPWLRSRGIAVPPLRPSNCGFDTVWSSHFSERFAGCPVKPVAASFTDLNGQRLTRRGEFVITRTGVEGGLVYALSAPLRDLIEAQGQTSLRLDLAPDRTEDDLLQHLQPPRGGRSLGNALKRAGLSSVKSGLLREHLSPPELDQPARLAEAIKSLPLRLTATRPLEEAISSAGGVAFEALDSRLMLRQLPGVFCAGEMLDWEAPTGGYLLTACLATGRAAGLGAAAWVKG